MSVKVMARVWEHSQASGGELLVMLALADFANDDGECWPSVPVLAQKARLTDREVRYLLPKLESAGELCYTKSNGGRNRRNWYVITVSENPETVSVKNFHGIEKPCNNFTEIHDTKTLKPTSGALNHHRTVIKNVSVPKDGTDHSPPKKKSDHQEVMALYHDLYVKKFGADPAITAVDGNLVKQLLGGNRPMDEIKGVLRFYFDHPDEFSEKNGHFCLKQIVGGNRYTQTLARMKAEEKKTKSYSRPAMDPL